MKLLSKTTAHQNDSENGVICQNRLRNNKVGEAYFDCLTYHVIFIGYLNLCLKGYKHHSYSCWIMFLHS